MKRSAVVLILTVLLLNGCGDQSPPTAEEPKQKEATEVEQMAGNRKISAEEAVKMMEEEGTTVVDVRRPDEYAGGHIEGAILVPLGTLGEEAATKLPDKDETLLVYCRSGSRSHTASQMLIEMGYRRVYDLGGIINWPYGIVK